MVFSKQQTDRPLFQPDRTHDWEEEEADIWSKRSLFGYGKEEDSIIFSVGGDAALSLAQLGQQYFDSAEALVWIVVNDRGKLAELSNPIVFLYRHSIELFMKACLPNGDEVRGHNFTELYKHFDEHMKTKHGAQVPKWILKRLKEFTDMDPQSMTFRYNQDGAFTDGDPVLVDLAHFRSAMMALNTALVGVIASEAIDYDGAV